MIYWLLYIAAEIIIQNELIKIGWKPNYYQLFILRGLASVVNGAIIDVESFSEYFMLLAFQVTSFWILLDLGLNYLRGKVWYYKGKESGWLDSLPLGLYLVLKAIVAVLLIFLTILYAVRA